MLTDTVCRNLRAIGNGLKPNLKVWRMVEPKEIWDIKIPTWEKNQFCIEVFAQTMHFWEICVKHSVDIIRYVWNHKVPRPSVWQFFFSPFLLQESPHWYTCIHFYSRIILLLFNFSVLMSYCSILYEILGLQQRLFVSSFPADLILSSCNLHLTAITWWAMLCLSNKFPTILQ